MLPVKVCRASRRAAAALARRQALAPRASWGWLNSSCHPRTLALQKPQNVLLVEGGRAKVCDFGISKSFGATAASSTRLQPGTPSYMAPEQVGGQRGGEAGWGQRGARCPCPCVLACACLCVPVRTPACAPAGDERRCAPLPTPRACTAPHPLPPRRRQFEGRPVTDRVDVFAFGVLLWEVLARRQPWRELSAMQIIFAVGIQVRPRRIADLDLDIAPRPRQPGPRLPGAATAPASPELTAPTPHAQ